MPLNFWEKAHAVLVSDRVRIWDYFGAKPPLKPHQVWAMTERGWSEAVGFDRVVDAVEYAYSIIDPLAIPVPEQVPPSQCEDHATLDLIRYIQCMESKEERDRYFGNAIAETDRAVASQAKSGESVAKLQRMKNLLTNAKLANLVRSEFV